MTKTQTPVNRLKRGKVDLGDQRIAGDVHRPIDSLDQWKRDRRQGFIVANSDSVVVDNRVQAAYVAQSAESVQVPKVVVVLYGDHPPDRLQPRKTIQIFDTVIASYRQVFPDLIQRTETIDRCQLLVLINRNTATNNRDIANSRQCRK